MEQSAVEWFAKELYEKFEMKGDGKVFDELLEQAKEMEKEQKEPLLNYIKDVRDVCGKHHNPTETELHYLSIRAENILSTFKSE